MQRQQVGWPGCSPTAHSETAQDTASFRQTIGGAFSLYPDDHEPSNLPPRPPNTVSAVLLKHRLVSLEESDEPRPQRLDCLPTQDPLPRFRENPSELPTKAFPPH